MNSERRTSNYGEKLYHRGMRRMYERDAFMSKAKSEQDKAEVEAYSFRPQINPVSRVISRQGNERPEDFLIKYGKAVKEKIDS